MVTRILSGLATVALALLTSGCVAHLTREVAPPPTFTYQPPTEAHPLFTYANLDAVQVSEPVDRMRHHEVHRVHFTSSARTGNRTTVEGQFFRSTQPGARKLVIVLPIWGTSTYPPSRISRGYARRSGGDAHVLWVFGEAPLFPWEQMSTSSSEAEFMRMAEESAERYRAAVIDLRRLLDWAEQRDDVDASRIAVVGFSMSALVAATTVANDSRLSTAVLMVGAAEFADIFATCGHRAGEVRAHVLENYGWTLEEYRSFFQDLFDPADPVNYPGHFDRDSILMIDARFDDCMPRSSREALWEITGFPSRVVLLSRHRHSFYTITPLGLNFIRRKIYRFLDETL